VNAASRLPTMSTPDEKRKGIETEQDWERVLSAAAHLQSVVPDAVLVGGTAAAVHAAHRFSYDDDHVVFDLKSRFERVLSDLEQQAGWITDRVQPPVLILGSLQGVETGVRNLIRSEPLEVETIETKFGAIVLPTLHEMARIKAWLALTRNATRDYIDFVALATKIETTEGTEALQDALRTMDSLYPQSNGSSVLLQLAKQLAEPLPRDLGDGDLRIYRIVSPEWLEWNTVKQAARRYGQLLLREFGR
jgi:hypothetical protein